MFSSVVVFIIQPLWMEHYDLQKVQKGLKSLPENPQAIQISPWDSPEPLWTCTALRQTSALPLAQCDPCGTLTQHCFSFHISKVYESVTGYRPVSPRTGQWRPLIIYTFFSWPPSFLFHKACVMLETSSFIYLFDFCRKSASLIQHFYFKHRWAICCLFLLRVFLLCKSSYSSVWLHIDIGIPACSHKNLQSKQNCTELPFSTWANTNLVTVPESWSW